MSAEGKVPFLLANATLTLYRTNAAGSPITATPVWFGACEEQIRIEERWITAQSTPAGRRYPKRRALVPQYQIGINRLWVQQRDALGDFVPTSEVYVLDVLWYDEEMVVWHRKTFYGVTIDSRTWQSTEVFELRDEQMFNAEYYTEVSGTGTAPGIAESLPLWVRWVGSDAVLALYTYDTGTNGFTAVGVTTGRATAEYVPDQSGSFVVTFDGGIVALEVIGEEARVGAILEGAPGPAVVPRLDFMVGTSRVASVSANKDFYAFSAIDEDEPTEGLNTFRIQAGSDTVLVIGATSARADAFVEEL